MDRVLEELWIQVCNTVQKVVIKTIPKKKKFLKSKMVVWGGLKNSWEKKRSERQRRKGKKCPSECGVPKNSKERIRNTSSEINAKKRRKTIEWERLEIFLRKLEIPGEHFRQRWAQQRTEMVWTWQKLKILIGGKNTQKNYIYIKKNLNDPDNYKDVITHLEPDILQCEKLVEVMEFQLRYFKP